MYYSGVPCFNKKKKRTEKSQQIKVLYTKRTFGAFCACKFTANKAHFPPLSYGSPPHCVYRGICMHLCGCVCVPVGGHVCRYERLTLGMLFVF